MNKRFLIICLLGFSSGLPLTLLSSTLQAWYAEMGTSVLATGMLSLIHIPYAYRVLWGPLVDRFTILPLGKRRGWILATQLALLTGFLLIVCFSPQTYPHVILLLAFMLACLSATQDIAIDAHRVEYLNKEEYGLGAAIASLGYRLALVMGGITLVLAQHLGWIYAYRIMASLIILGMITILWSNEPKGEQVKGHVNLMASFTSPIKELLSRPYIIYLICFVLFYKLGEAFTTTTSGIVIPFLIQSVGFSLEMIGYVNNIIGITALILGGITAGLILMRYSLFSALMAFGVLQAITNSLFILLAIAGKNLPIFISAAICDNFASGMGSTALVVLFMRLVNKSFTGTQFSFLVAIASLPRIFSGPLSATLQMWFGWVGLYELAFILSLFFIPFLIALSKELTLKRELGNVYVLEA